MGCSVVILGCGYTGRLVASRLASTGFTVIATSRSPESLPQSPCIQRQHLDAEDEAPSLAYLPRGARILYSIPTVGESPDSDASVRLIGRLAEFQPTRVVYLSTTGVYGSQTDVNEKSEPAPRRPQDHARLAAEGAALRAGTTGIVLRPAAIYGPGRGIHVSMREGRFRMGGDGSNYVSRINVEDLAAHCEAALFADEIGGAWPVADEYPCTTREIAEFCAELLDVPMPPSVEAEALHHTRQANRRVDGRAIRAALGIALKYPSYREGIPASV